MKHKINKILRFLYTLFCFVTFQFHFHSNPGEGNCLFICLIHETFIIIYDKNEWLVGESDRKNLLRNSKTKNGVR
jgi:hypothetical protein